MKMWLARDFDSSLALYERESNLVANKVWSGGCSMWLDSNNYPEVTFENSPMEVELVIKK